MTESETLRLTARVDHDGAAWSSVVEGLPPMMFAGFQFDTWDEIEDGTREGLIDLLGHNQFVLTLS